MKPVRAIIFDLGGVILSRGLWKFRAYLCEQYGVTDQQTREVIINTYYRSYFGGTLSEEEFWNSSLRDLGITADWHQLREILFDFYTPQVKVIDVIKQLRAQGYQTYLLSDQSKDWWPVLNERYGIDTYFDKTFISAEIGFHKPDPRFYEYVLKECKLEPNQTLFIDDLNENLIPAQDLGMKILLFVDEEQFVKDIAQL